MKNTPTPPSDGGPAFPYAFQHEDDSHFTSGGFAPGMSLRDWFAGQALAGLLSCHSHQAGEDFDAKQSYAFADAMLTERAKTTEGSK